VELTVEVPSRSRLGALRRVIVDWGEANRRDLPWRRTRDPWSVLVSEFMLQQTQVSRVLEPYRRFISRFPSAPACAEAPLADVVVAWRGLGYNRRAVRLHQVAQLVVERHGGNVPGELGALRALPGVGPYTARAVLAFAYEADTGVVDTNVARVLSRAVAGEPLAVGPAQTLADALVPPGRSWVFNQALFDLGARHCHARAPECGDCPLRSRCRWARGGWLAPDPARHSAGTSKPQSRFEGSDRQGRGRLIDALRRSPVKRGELAGAAGWPEDPDRARRVAEGLVSDGLARWEVRGELALA
jgi:A/G-specific adenine glycosylase